MKKLILLLFAFSVSFLNTEAQNKPFRYGAKAGLNLSKFVDKIPGAENDNSPRLGFIGSGFFEINYENKFAFEVELAFAAKGNSVEYSKYDDNLGNTDIKDIYALNYIDFNIFMKIYPLKKGYFIFGPHFGFLVSSKLKSDKNGEKGSASGEIDLSDYLRSLDPGISLGIGYETNIGLFFEGRYDIGFSDILKKDFQGQTEIKNSVFTFTAGYYFSY